MDRNDPRGIDERSFQFLKDVLTFVDTIRVGPKTKDIIEQLVDAAGSIGFGSQKQCIALLDEARQEARILGRIVVTSKKRDAGNNSGPAT
jgi:hypothetical protein